MLLDDEEGVFCRDMVLGAEAVLEARNAEVILCADVTPYAHLERGVRLDIQGKEGRNSRTVAVMSFEQTSQMYFSPPSVPLDMVFFRSTPMLKALG